MFHTLLRLLHLLQLAIAYNLVIDTQTKGIVSYIRGLRGAYKDGLENHSVPKIRKKRCLGQVELTDITVTEVQVGSTETVVAGGDYHLRIEHLSTLLHGSYFTNVLFIRNTGDFQLRIRDLNASLGPLVPINIGGIPYVNQDISCSIWHKEDHIEVSGGILRWLARKRLRDTMKEDLESILCDSLVEILDRKIRQSLGGLKLVLPVNEATSISYLIAGQPLLLPYGAVRTYHSGITSTKHVGEKFIPSALESQHHVIYQIHEGLLTEVVQSVCSRGFLDGNFTVSQEYVQVTCQKASVSLKNMEALHTANIMLAISLTFRDGRERAMLKNYSVSVLHSSRLRVLFRLRSEIVSTTQHNDDYGDQIFSMLSEVVRLHVNVPLPIPDGAHTDRSMIKLLPDRILFATDFVFRKR
ncbi:hypothetical protein Q1695_013028 [Nippostrongylus brasiliensis]|nr:hypothetical protein Q1695_013028 [Nippostrongylus brasiliensis]